METKILSSRELNIKNRNLTVCFGVLQFEVTSLNINMSDTHTTKTYIYIYI